MPFQTPQNLTDLLEHLKQLRSDCHKAQTHHESHLKSFIDKYGKPEAIFSRFQDNPKVQKLAIRVKEYYAQVNSAFLVFETSLDQLENASPTLDKAVLSSVLSKIDLRVKYDTYRLSKKAKSYSNELCYVFNYLEVVDSITLSIKQMDEHFKEFMRLNVILSQPLTFRSVIAMAKEKSKAPQRQDSGSWGSYFVEANNATEKLLQQPVAQSTDLNSSGEDWDAELDEATDSLRIFKP